MFKLTNRFQVAVRLFNSRSQMTSKCGKNKKVAQSVSLMFLPHFDVFKEFENVLMMTSSIRLSSNRS